MDSSMDLILCFWDASFIPLTLIWKVDGIEVVKCLDVAAFVPFVAELDSCFGNWRLGWHLFVGILLVVGGLLVRLLCGLRPSFLRGLVVIDSVD